jgi:hypothetical protein|tara:strand:+ start:2336 stop:2695 length:360 start_codon:yes stop_codon:yes gene_type:complete
MAVVNQYKFYGVDNDTTGAAITMFGTTTVQGVATQNPLINETYIIKSIKVTSAGTPTVTITNNAITTIKTAALTANQTEELLTQPLIVEGNTVFKITSSTSDSFDIAISYLNIKKERLD